jgi:hypothetical protein
MKNKNMKKKNAQKSVAIVLSIILVIAMVLSLAAPFFN